MSGFFSDGSDDSTLVSLPNEVQLIHRDAFTELSNMEDGSVDVIISDPPYSSKTHEGARTTVGGRPFQRGGSPQVLLTFDSITPEQFVEFATQSVRVTKRWVITFCDWRFVHLLEEVGLVRLGVWTKTQAAPQFTGDRPAQGWEAIAILHRPGKKRWNGGGKSAVWRHGRVDAEFSTAQKPLPLMRELVRLFSDPGETVLDPFCGSGSTGVACLQTGRKFIGIEKDEKTYKIAHKRLTRRR